MVQQEFLDKERTRPKKKYVLVPKNRDEYGVGYYESLGYKLTPLSRDGARLRAMPSAAKDAPIQEYRGCLLMEIDSDVYADLQEHGETGDGGTTYFEQLAQQISDPKSLAAFGGIQGDKYVREQNKTEDAETILGDM